MKLNTKIITREQIDDLENLESDLCESKYPTANKSAVGIEIEFISTWENMEIAQLIVNNNLRSYCQLKDDGSIEEENSGEYGHELAVLCTQQNYKKVLKKICAILKHIGAYSNDSCGLHVHVDIRNRDSELVYYNLVNQQHVLFSMVSPERLTSEYCTLAKYSDVEIAKRKGRTAINACAINEHGSIEVRLHHGTVDFKEITNWIGTLLKVASARYQAEPSKSLADFKRKFKLNNTMLKHARKQVRIWNKKMLSEFSIDHMDIETYTGIRENNGYGY